MAYTALYRKFRPLQFSQVVGQDHITTILKNQVKTGHIAHAYLFCGSRGTGKTSSAKILARAVNCLSPHDGEPCTECDSCKRYLSEDAVDIIEIDAASNNGVDDVRTLIDNARYTPLHMSRKVYIIDEVHMLTNQAFNALLKTLEEPPAHVVFILATTEPQKLPATIISRCQRFDFKRLSIQDIKTMLKSVVEQSDAHVDEEGLIAIARAAEGGMRDALSLTDQCLSFCGTHVSLQDVYDVLGCMQQDVLLGMADSLIAGDAGGALRQFDAVIASGRDVGIFLQDLIRHYRALLLTRACGNCQDILDCTNETMALYRKQTQTASEAGLLRSMQALIDASAKLKFTSAPRVLVETTLLTLCRPQEEQSLLALEQRIAGLEQALNDIKTGAAQIAAPSAKPAKTAAQSQDELPPWGAEEAAKTAAPVAAKESTANTEQRSAAAATAAAAPPAANDANAIWQHILTQMKKRSQLHIYVAAERASSATLSGTVLTVWFTPANAAMSNLLKVPANQKAAEALLQEIQPGLTLAVGVERQDPALQDLSDTFGSLFRVEE